MKQSGYIPITTIEHCEAIDKLMRSFVPIDIAGRFYQITEVSWGHVHGGHARIVPVIDFEVRQ